jgi:hypothetical protein
VADALATADPAARAARWLAGLTGGVAPDVGRATQFDLRQLWRSLPVDPADPSAVAAFLILGDRAAGVATTPGRLVSGLRGGVGDAQEVRVIRAATGLYPEGSWPALLLLPEGRAGGIDPAAGVRALEPLAAAEPRLPLGVALTSGGYRTLVAGGPASRAAALAREGLVELSGVDGNELARRLRAAGIEPLPPPATIHRLTESGLAEEVAEAFVRAAGAARGPDPDAAREFRSAAERFLHEQLESLPETAGLFRPNRPLGFRHGPQPAEADLLADRPKVVVEVDGGHYHLTPDQYRRDRRKDWLYQRHGYLVLRFLAEDVVEDLPAILATILEAVAARRPPTPTGGDP